MISEQSLQPILNGDFDLPVDNCCFDAYIIAKIG